ncbi:MAG: hypothetical protein LBQ86_08990 [Holophagales bacterium]|jgi:hypothetical protein|nr:hypothetical protein [Holophagales bacterium]
MDFIIGSPINAGMGDHARRGGYAQGADSANSDDYTNYVNSANNPDQTDTALGADRSDRSGRTARTAAARQNQDGDRETSQTGDANSGDSLELSPEAQRMLEDLKARDKAVRTHEAAHLAAGAGITKGGAQYTTQRGPDGNMYAIGGEVPIDASEVPNDPQATIAKARQIAAAAMAPADPSPQDRAVAAQARQMESQASLDLSAQQAEEAKESRESDADGENNVGNAGNAEDADAAGSLDRIDIDIMGGATQTDRTDGTNTTGAPEASGAPNTNPDGAIDANASRDLPAQAANDRDNINAQEMSAMSPQGRQAVNAYNQASTETNNLIARVYQVVA